MDKLLHYTHILVPRALAGDPVAIAALVLGGFSLLCKSRNNK